MSIIPRTPTDSLEKEVEEFYHFGPRRPGSEIGKRFEDFFCDRFRELGLQPEKQRIPLTAWECHEWELKVGSRVLPSFYVPYTEFTGENGIRAPLVHLSQENLVAQRETLRGKIVVVDFRFPDLVGWQLKAIALHTADPKKKIPNGSLHPATWIRPQWKLYQESEAAGAAGFIGILNNQPGDLCSYFAPYGFREGDAILKKSLPAFWVSAATGQTLREAAGSTEVAQLKLLGSRFPSETHNIIGHLPGVSSRNFLVGCHHDTPFKNAVEDSSGLAALLRVIRGLKERGPPLQHGIVAVATGGHFYGSIGTRQLIAHRRDLIEKTDLAFWMEHFGFSAHESNGGLISSGTPEPAGLFTTFNKNLVRTIARLLDKHKIHPSLILPPESPLGNYPPTDGGDFYAEGIPILNSISNPVYLLVDSDRMDFVDFERIRNFAAFGIDFLLEIDAMDRAQLWNRDFKIRHKFLAYAAKRMSSH